MASLSASAYSCSRPIGFQLGVVPYDLQGSLPIRVLSHALTRTVNSSTLSVASLGLAPVSTGANSLVHRHCRSSCSPIGRGTARDPQAG